MNNNDREPTEEGADDKNDENGMGDDEGAHGDSSSTSGAEYDAYRREYCLRFIQLFFNHHLDDSWFRSRYSPSVKRKQAALEQERAAREARVLFRQATAGTSEENKENAFLEQARLGGGSKTGTNQIPSSHLLDISDRIMHVVDIPSYVTDEQLDAALMEHVDIIQESRDKSKKKRPSKQSEQMNNNGGDDDAEEDWIQVYSGSVHTTFSQKKRREAQPAYLSRQAVVLCSSKRLMQDLLARLTEEDKNLKRRRRGSAIVEVPPIPPTNRTVVPRKDKGSQQVQQWLDFELDSTDPYGRLEYDADGKGGAPANGLAIPSRKAVVRIASYNLQPSVHVLSAALSSQTRVQRDKDSALVLARALDVAQQIPVAHRLDELLERLNQTEMADVDILDVALAYLKRVHLFSFYNGCSRASNVADVLTGQHSSGVIHLRMEGADEVMEAAAAAATDEAAERLQIGDGTAPSDAKGEPASEEKPRPPPKDLLVQRLDDSIAKALEDCNEWINSGAYVVDEQTDQRADAIESAENDLRETWLRNHAILDDDNRARCSFHFCHKLFKGTSFLYKHLFKKHGEFLKAEQAKCHDEEMMAEWDSEEMRPIPEILVDCGAKFGLVSVPVHGRIPDCTDPEPDLWRREEERREREREQRQRREEVRERHRQQHEEQQSQPRAAPSRFVDVDDMKEEKVDLAFDKVPIPPPVTKKKKKKRKLL